MLRVTKISKDTNEITVECEKGHEIVGEYDKRLRLGYSIMMDCYICKRNTDPCTCKSCGCK